MQEWIGMEGISRRDLDFEGLDFKSLINLVWFVGFGMRFEFQSFVNLVWFVGFGRGFTVHPLLVALTNSQFSSLGVRMDLVGSLFWPKPNLKANLSVFEKSKTFDFRCSSFLFGFKPERFKNVLVFDFRDYNGQF